MTYCKRLMVMGLGAIGLVGLPGCTGSTDPATAGLFDNVVNLSGGTYKKQEAANNARIAELSAQKGQLEGENAALEQQRQANAQSLSALKSNISRAKGEAQTARATATPAEAATLNRADAEIVRIEKAVAGGGDPVALQNDLNRVLGTIRTVGAS